MVLPLHYINKGYKMLEITLVRTTSNNRLQVLYKINGIPGARFFKNFDKLDEFKAKYIL